MGWYKFYFYPSTTNNLKQNYSFYEFQISERLCWNDNHIQINDIYELGVAKFIHYYNQKRPPKNLNMSFKPTINSTVMKQDLLQMRSYYLKRVTLQHTKSSYFFNGLKIWNPILLKIKNLSKQSFSKWFKINKINQYYLKTDLQ